MCAKHQRSGAVLLQIREEALEEWTRAQTYSDVCRAWGRLGGRVTLHRFGRGHFAELARRRRRAALWGSISATGRAGVLRAPEQD
jgi:hypothetical protein